MTGRLRAVFGGFEGDQECFTRYFEECFGILQGVSGGLRGGLPGVPSGGLRGVSTWVIDWGL